MRATFFLQPCPTCGRHLQIRVEYLGQTLVCQHCRAEFLASDTDPSFELDQQDPVMERADELLATAQSRRIR